jgi:hypothetical protein
VPTQLAAAVEHVEQRREVVVVAVDGALVRL